MIPEFTDLPTTKRCSKCNVVKPADCFTTDKRSKSGLHSSCKECYNEYQRNRRSNDEEYRENRNAKIRVRRSKLRANDKEYLDNRRADNREYMKQRRANDPEWNAKYRAMYKKWLLTPEGKLYNRIRSQDRRDWAKKTNDGSVTPEAIQKKRDLQNNRCYYEHCGKLMNDIKYHPDQWTIEHIVARANGGLNILSNIVIACAECNRSKSDSDLEEWLDSYQGEIK